MDRAANGRHGGVRKIRQAASKWATEQLENRVFLSASSTATGVIPALFVENRGQWDAAVRYALQTRGANVLMTDQGPIFQVFQPTSNDSVLGEQFIVGFENSNTVRPVGAELTGSTFNYFTGDKSQWRSAAKSYQKVVYSDLYDGIDLHTWGQKNNLKYEFHVAPGADYSQVKVSYNGIKGLSIDSKGRLHIKTQTGELIDDAPVVYQVVNGKREYVKAQFKLLDKDSYTFQLNGKFDASRELILDPLVDWATYLGDTDADVGNGIALDDDNNSFVTGQTESPLFPTLGADLLTAGFQRMPIGDDDAFVAKFNSAGFLVWGTYLGGAEDDTGHDLAVDDSGNVFVVGETGSSDFPYQDNLPGGSTGVPSPLDTYHGGDDDAFLTYISADGELNWSGFIGGSTADRAFGIEIDDDGQLYIAGFTNSTGATTGFPVIAGFQPARSGQADGFVLRFDPGSRTIAWSTYFGGTGNNDQINGIALGDDGEVYITGTTNSADGLATLGAQFDTIAGGTDAFIAKITQAVGPTLAWSTYLGGTGAELGNAIAVGPDGNVWVTGSTAAGSTDFPLDIPPITRLGNTDAFLSTFDEDGDLRRSVLIASSGADTGTGIAVDSANNVIVVGNAGMPMNTVPPSGLPVVNALPGNGVSLISGFSHSGGQNDGFIGSFTASGATNFLTYYGGAGVDVLNAVEVDGSNGIFAVGTTSSVEIMLGAPAWDLTLNGGNDAMVLRIAPTNFSLRPVAPTNLTAIAASMTSISLTWIDNADNELGYGVARFTSINQLFEALSNPDAFNIATLPANRRGYTDTGLSPSTQYFYVVYAFNLAGNAVSNFSFATTRTAALNAPSGLKATAVSASRIDLSWSDNSDNETNFEVWRHAATVGIRTKIATLAAGTKTYIDQSGLAADTEYRYEVRAINAFRASNFVGPVAARTKLANFIVAPSGLVVTRLSATSNRLNWQDNSNNETSFSIERAPVGSTSWSVIGSTAANVTVFTDSTVPSGSLFTYRVRGINGGNQSAYSNSATANINNALQAPVRLEALAVNSESIKLTFIDKSVVESGTVVERSISSSGDWEVVATIAPNATVWYDKKLAARKTYFYRLRATSGTSFSAYTGVVSDKTLPIGVAPPRTPSAFKVQTLSSSSLKLSWKDNASGETGYAIERATSAEGAFTVIARIGVNSKTFTDKGLAAGRSFYYRVRALDGSFRGGPSAIVRGTTTGTSKVTAVATKAATSSSIVDRKSVVSDLRDLRLL